MFIWIGYLNKTFLIKILQVAESKIILDASSFFLGNLLEKYNKAKISKMVISSELLLDRSICIGLTLLEFLSSTEMDANIQYSK